jgi:hypothetical protein
MNLQRASEFWFLAFVWTLASIAVGWFLRWLIV